MSAWKRLWVHDIPEEELDRFVNTDWLRRVKAEGDKLKAKNEGIKNLILNMSPSEDIEKWRKGALKHLGVEE